MTAQHSAATSFRASAATPGNCPSAEASAAQRIILIRHGQPDIAVAPRTSHRGFGSYIDAYEEAGLDPASAPPEELQDLVGELSAVFTSGRKRADDSARALAPRAELIADPLFAEAPLASPRIPLLRMTVPKWAVVARILWHAGYHPEIENYRRAKHRAASAADILVARAHRDGVAALVAHGYFNLILGRELRQRGFVKTGAHRARFWNVVIYDRGNRRSCPPPRAAWRRRGMAKARVKARARARDSQHRRDDAVGRLVAVGEGLDVDNHLLAHVHAAFERGGAHVGQEHHVLLLEKPRIDGGLAFEDIEAGADRAPVSSIRASAFSSITSPRAVFTM